jgi:tetratricopeptide (TPR) repeat protein
MTGLTRQHYAGQHEGGHGMAAPTREERDFFVSYTQADLAWAKWLAWELEDAGYTTVLQAWDMVPGTSFVHAMDQATKQTGHILLVLSAAYLRSEMAEAEWRSVFVDDPSGEKRRLLPVRVEPCEAKGLLADRVYIDLLGLDEATARARLRQEIANALRGHARPADRPRFPRAPAAARDRPRFPTALPPVWNVPFHRNPLFTGRDAELAALAATLERGGTAAVTQVLQGGGGVGKTSLAVEFAYRQRARFDTVWWVRAEDPATLVADYADLVRQGVAEADQADQQGLAMATRRWLEANDRWLLVLDNAGGPDARTGLTAPLVQVRDLLPQVVHGQLLITSRDARWEQYGSLEELEVFSPQEAVAFLLARAGAGDEQAAAAVAELLGWLPLALEQAGAYVRETRIPLGTYLERLRQFPTVTLARGRPRDRDPADTVATTWQVSLEQIRPVPGAEALLELCAFLGPEEIPRELPAQPLDPPPEELAVLADEPFAFDDAVAELRRYGLIKASEQALSVHRLVQQVIREHLDPATKAARAAAAVRLVREVFPAEHTNPAVWEAYKRLLPHALAVSDHAQALGIESEQVAWLLNEAGLYLWQRADHQQARALFERALAIREAHLGQDHPDTAYSLNNLAGIWHDRGDLDTARALYERALASCEASVGPDHPAPARVLTNLGIVLRDQGDLDGARALQERALAIFEASVGPDHPAPARVLANLAELRHDHGDLDTARALYERALAIFEASVGPDRPEIAGCLQELATVLHDQGDLDGARLLHERVLAIRETHLGPDHPLTAESLHHLGTVLYAQGDLDGARSLHERALAINKTRLGPDHPDTGRSKEALEQLMAELEDPS